MAARIHIYTVASDFSELAETLRDFAYIADQCSKVLAEGSREHYTDGFNNSLEGLDSLAKLLGSVVGVYAVEPAKLLRVRQAIDLERQKKSAEKAEAKKLALEIESFPKKSREVQKVSEGAAPKQSFEVKRAESPVSRPAKKHLKKR
jgi:hypothetical protein